LQFCCGRLDFYHVYVKRKLTFLRALCELDNLVDWWFVRVFLCLNGHRNAINSPLSSAFNCIIDVFSVVEFNKCVFSTLSKLVREDS